MRSILILLLFFKTRPAYILGTQPYYEDGCTVTDNKVRTEKKRPTYQDDYYYTYRQKYGRDPDQRYFPEEGQYYYIYTETQIFNSTITCRNLDSTEKISHDYKEEEYEQFLKITFSNIPILQPLSFVSFSTITKLYLSQIHIKTIKPGAFNGLTRLRELHLDNNELSEVLNGVYNTLHRLEFLNFTNNNILTIDRYAFMGVANLATLYLKNNNVSKIEEGLFETQRHVKFLDLSDNPVEELSLEGLTNLETLTLAGSSLREFNEDLSNYTMTLMDLSSSELSSVDFAYFPKINRVDLSRNKIVVVKNCEMLDTVVVNLDTNSINEINGSFNGVSEIYLGHNKLEILESELFVESKNVLVIDVRFNKISSVDKSVFRQLRSLKKLSLQNNGIVKIDPVLFRDLTSLTYLNLSYNKIQEFQYGTFDSLTSLEILDISGNRLVDLHQDTFNSLASLMTLRFDNNQISSLDVSNLRTHLPSLQYVSLDKNPWTCKELVKIGKIFGQYGPIFRHVVSISDGNDYDVENFHGIACSNQKSVSAVNVSGVSLKKFTIDFQKAIDEGVKNSKMKHFFDGDFKDSKFFQYFDKDYERSNFFRFLNDFKFVTVKQNSNESKAEKFTSVQMTPYEHNVSAFQILVVVLLFSVLLSVMFIGYILISFLKKIKSTHEPERLSQIELC